MKRKAVLLICALVLLALGIVIHSKLVSYANNDEFPFAAKHDLSFPDYLPDQHGYSELTVNKHLVTVGGEISFDVRFFNTSSRGATFYNPFFNRLTYLPAKLAVYDIHKKYVRDLIAFSSGSFYGGGDPVFIPSKCDVGATIQVHLYDVHPGIYYLQLVYLKNFVVGYNGGSFQREHGGEELFRSNFVKIIVL
jgi:hypothetical protein